MNTDVKISRRNLLQLGASAGMLMSLGRFRMAQAQTATDYKALVCLFMFGGNDGHNMVVPMTNPQYSSYVAARQGLGLGINQLLPFTDPVQGQFGFHYSMPEMRTLSLCAPYCFRYVVIGIIT